MTLIPARHPQTGAIRDFAVDDEDAAYVLGFRWRISAAGYPLTTRYFIGDKQSRTICVARLLLQPNEPGLHVDHIDGDPMNNRRSNLRLATNSQNQANRRRLPKNTSGFRGVTWHKKCKKWQAAIKVSGKNHHLGLFVSVEDAGRAYAVAAHRFFGEFAAQHARAA